MTSTFKDSPAHSLRLGVEVWMRGGGHFVWMGGWVCGFWSLSHTLRVLLPSHHSTLVSPTLSELHPFPRGI